MKTILKNIITASLLLAQVTASAQSELLEALPVMLQQEFGIEPKKSISLERDVLKEGSPLQSRCEIYTFTLTRKQQEKVLKGMRDEFEVAGRDKNCYSVNSMNELTGQESLRNLMIGDDVQHYITIGKDYKNYINVNILDAHDTARTHRYAYALEWRTSWAKSEKGAIDVRYIITYAKIPSKLNRYGKVPIQDKVLIKGDSLFNVIREVNGKPLKAMGGAVNQSVAGVNTLLMFSSLKKYYQKHKDAELTAISIYSLCKRANEEGLFRDDSLGELEQLICEVDKLTENAKTETDRTYFQKAREQLDEIMKSRK